MAIAMSTSKETVSSTNKRKLSLSAEEPVGQAEVKRVKGEQDVEGPPEAQGASLSLDAPSESTTSEDTQTASSASPAVEDTFYTYGDSMIGIFDIGWDCSYIWRKTAIHEAHDAWVDFETKTQNAKDTNAGLSSLEVWAKNLAEWEIHVADEESRKGARAQKLVKAWDEELKAGKKEQRWYEVLMQRREPEGEDAAALEVELEYEGGARDDGKESEGIWWITGFRPADDAHLPLKHFHDYVPFHY